jgi:cell fate (sporulation/competence/biofilm development) regulator YmcA (YheA/YmcA/DUF963 family)
MSSGTSEEDPTSNFFITLSAFIKAFNASIEDNRKMKEDQEKVVRKQQEALRMKENRAARAASVAVSASEVVTAIEGKGIFADFKKSQSRQADEIINKRRSDRRAAATKISTPGSMGSMGELTDERRRRRRPSLVREDASNRHMRTIGSPKPSMNRMISERVN